VDRPPTKTKQTNLINEKLREEEEEGKGGRDQPSMTGMDEENVIRIPIEKEDDAQ
jgi:hypothetical protein